MTGVKSINMWKLLLGSLVTNKQSSLVHITFNFVQLDFSSTVCGFVFHNYAKGKRFIKYMIKNGRISTNFLQNMLLTVNIL